MSRTAWLVELKPWDPVGAQVTTVRLTNDFGSIKTNGQHWIKRLSSGPPIRVDIALRDEVVQAESNFGALIIERDEHTEFLKDYYYDGRDVTVWMGDSGDTFGNFTKVFVGTAQSIDWDKERIVLSLRDFKHLLDVPLLTETYGGGGGLDGDSGAKGKFKPFAAGHVLQAQPVLIDASNLVYHFCAYASPTALTTVRSRGVEISIGTTSHANMAALVAASIPEGEVQASLADGVLRFGSQPVDPVTVEFTAPDTKMADAIQRMAEDQAGLDPSRIRTSSFSAFNTAVPDEIGVYHDRQITVSRAITELLYPIRAYWLFEPPGEMVLGQISIGASSETIDEDKMESFARRPTPTPIYKVRLGHSRNHRPLSEGEIAPELTPATITIQPNKAYTTGTDTVVTDSGEAIIHGFDGSGNPDPARDGEIIHNGQRISIPRAQGTVASKDFTVATSQTQVGFIVFETAQNQPFTIEGDSVDVAFIRKVSGGWEYDNGSGWVSFTKTSTMVIIGTLTTDGADSIEQATVFQFGQSLDNVGAPGADVTPFGQFAWRLGKSAAGTSDAHFIHFHGFGSDGLADTTVPATFQHPDGTKVTLGSATSNADCTLVVSASLPAGSYHIVLDGSLANRFTNSNVGSQSNELAAVRISKGVSEYAERATGDTHVWQEFTPDGDYFIIGTAKWSGSAWTELKPLSMTLDAAPEIGATVGSFGDEFSFYDNFDYDTLAQFQGQVVYQNQTGEEALTTGESGATAYQAGNNSGDDEIWFIYTNHFVPYNPAYLYRVRARVRRVSNTGTSSLYVGLNGWAADKSTKVNVSGSNLFTSQHYLAAANDEPSVSNGTWFTVVGYAKGSNTTGIGTVRSDPSNPGVLHNSVRYVTPLVIFNNADETGQWEIDWIEISVHAPDNTAENDSRNVIDGAVLPSGVAIDQGDGEARQFVSGVERFSAGDGDAITYARAYASVPDISDDGGGLVSTDLTLGLTPPYERRVRAIGASTTGFTADARLVEAVGGTTPISDTTEDTPTGGDPDEIIQKSTATEAWDDKYTYKFDCVVTNDPYIVEGPTGPITLYHPGWIKIGLYTRTGAGGWVLRSTATINGDDSSASTTRNNQARTIIVDGQGLADSSGAEFGITFEDSLYGGSLTDFNQVDYATATAPSDEDATNGGDNPVNYRVEIS